MSAVNPTVPATVRPDPASPACPSLTGLRFVAAGLVFAFHSSLTASPVTPGQPVNLFADPAVAVPYADVLNTSGFAAVSFFFVLSGFVLTWSHRPGEPGRSFVRRRLLKIYPNHAVTWALTMVLFAGAATPVSRWLPNLLLVHSFSPDPGASISVNSPSWSLCSELLFYLLFPLLIGPVSRLPERRLWPAAGVVVAAVAAVALLVQFAVTGGSGAGGSPSTAQFWLGYFFPPTRLPDFLLGMLIARIVRTGRWRRAGIGRSALAFAACYALSLWLPPVFRFDAVMIVPLGLLVGSFASADVRGARTGGLRSRPMVWLGEVSFAFYLCQGVVLLYGRTLMGGRQFSTGVAILVLLGFFLATVLAGWLLHIGAERPVMRRWGRRRAGLPAA